ncbi:exodeoxyribonuclease VII large subunit [Ramlibacter sp. H39-3-26]|uniref:exodeoxyribonuclease VII large subunit n=1 Tax=Curvibacter soli TaxID=3031331 RepID=UPI0023DAD043|nr:exodeoxyribonuclease VII large subunit [Ramlibacter sp. H39-3-26]MDF1483794.1 exodeoxyribonuclease VII large subunit [Ramlibacter sp. H39-3-26]
MLDARTAEFPPRSWEVGALCRAIADTVAARFNPVAVSGEISAFSRAASGHCYFTLKDSQGQLRCAMFRRASQLLDFSLRDGDHVEVRGRLDVYAPRGDLQLVVESVSRVGQGVLFERFLQLKARLEAEGLFDNVRKRALPRAPRAIGVVTSLGAAALRDVATALHRRVPHIPVTVVPAPVQGANAAAQLAQALGAFGPGHPSTANVDIVLLVRGGGSLEDLWAFNDEGLARAIAASPVPVVTGVGHETDFTIADFVADLRAPTPTAAAELAAEPRATWWNATLLAANRMESAVLRQLDGQALRLDGMAAHLGRPSAVAGRHALALQAQGQRLHHVTRNAVAQARMMFEQQRARLPVAFSRDMERRRPALENMQHRWAALDPRAILRRGYALLSDAQGRSITSARNVDPGQMVRAALVDGEVDLIATERLLF